MKIFLYFVGKPRDVNANSMAAGYVERICHFARCEMREVDAGKFNLQAKHPSALRIVLDPAGKVLDSRRFSELIGKAEDEGRDLVFGVGGTDGLVESWRTQATMELSLSAMTFPHELARVMIAEQIYRAFAILRGHPYPR